MQKVLALLAAAALASAQSLAGLPECATSCVSNAIPQNCNLDPACICAATSFIDAISCCVSTACDEADQAATLEYARTICAPVGVDNLPTAAGCSDNSTASATGSVAQSASSVVSSIASSVSDAVASATSEAGSATSEAAAEATDAAGKVNIQGLGVVGAGLLGVAALL